MKTLRVYQTHMELSPYTKGECKSLENYLSVWSKQLNRYTTQCFYYENNTLFIPRGISTSYIMRNMDITVLPMNYVSDYSKITSGEMLFEPKDTIQEDSIKFLCCKDQFSQNSIYNQFALTIDTGKGKTFCTIYSIMELGLKSIIITHQDKIKKQWIDTVEKMTTVKSNRCLNITGSSAIDMILNRKSSPKYDFYFVNHQTLASYARSRGWDKIKEFFEKIEVGIKVYDEAHLFFENSIMIDFFSNTKKTFYLTATFERSAYGEEILYKRSFSSVIKFGEETTDYVENRKHVVFIVVYFKSRPRTGFVPNLRNIYGFSSYKYIDYELNEGDAKILRVLDKIIDDTKRLEGKTLIISPKKSTVNAIADRISRITDDEVGRIYSDNTPEENTISKSKRYISSTIKSIGTGTDIKKLRVMINLEPIGSSLLASQVRGRLREYSSDKDTYLFYPVDTNVPEMVEMLQRIIPTMKKKCKEIIYMTSNV